MQSWPSVHLFDVSPKIPVFYLPNNGKHECSPQHVGFACYWRFEGLKMQPQSDGLWQLRLFLGGGTTFLMTAFENKSELRHGQSIFSMIFEFSSYVFPVFWGHRYADMRIDCCLYLSSSSAMVANTFTEPDKVRFYAQAHPSLLLAFVYIKSPQNGSCRGSRYPY